MKPTDRRRFPRARDVELTAYVTHSSRTATFRIYDLSASGARLEGAMTFAVGERIQLVIAEGARRALALGAEVVRVEPVHDGGHHAAVRFVRLPDAIQDAIQELVLRVLERSRQRAGAAVLVVDDVTSVCAALERDICSLGRAAIRATTPVEAIWRLEDQTATIDAAIVDLQLGAFDGHDVLAYLAEQHPEIRRVALSGVDSNDLARAIETGRAHTSLAKPWLREDVAHVLKVTP